MRLNNIFIITTLFSSIASTAGLSSSESTNSVPRRFHKPSELRRVGAKFAPRNRLSRREIPKYKCIVEDEPEEVVVENQQLKSEASTAKEVNEEEELERFVAILRAFIHETYFDVVSFKNSFDHLREHLSDINYLVHREKLTPDVSKQLAFAKNLFGVMEEALVEHLKETESSEKSENPWAYRITELVVQAWNLLDAYGSPDVKQDNFEGKALNIHGSIAHLRQLFEKHIVNAEQTIDLVLKSIWR